MSESMSTMEAQNMETNENKDAEPRSKEEQNDYENKESEWVVVDDESTSQTENNGCKNVNCVSKKKQTDEQQKQGIVDKRPENFSKTKYFLLYEKRNLKCFQNFMALFKTQRPDLHEVDTVEECDFILVFCPVLSQPDSDGDSALPKTNYQSGLKPTVLVVVYHTTDECFVPDSSRYVHGEKTFTIEESIDKIIKQLSQPPVRILPTVNKYFVCQTGMTLHSDQKFIDHLKTQISDLQEVNTVEDCDFILGFCPIASQSRTDIGSVLENLDNLSELKPAVVVVLHHNFDSDRIVPDSSRHVWRENTITVDSLLNEDQGLLQCSKKVIQQDESKIPEQGLGTKYFVLLTGNTINSHHKYIEHLKAQISGLQEVNTVEDCDFILVFSPVVSRSGTDIGSALQKLNNQSENKPAIVVVLHHTFDPECIVPDSSRHVKRDNTITVDCLFHEDQGLLQCPKNSESLNRVIQHFNNNSIIPEQSWFAYFSDVVLRSMLYIVKGIISGAMSLMWPGKKYFVLQTGNTQNSYQKFLDQLKTQISYLQEVNTVEDCDFILVFCPVTSRSGTDIESTLQKLNNQSENKPAVVVVLHHTFDPECIVPDSSRHVKRENTITVDCLFHEDQGLLQCPKNFESLNRVMKQVKSMTREQSGFSFSSAEDDPGWMLVLQEKSSAENTSLNEEQSQPETSTNSNLSDGFEVINVDDVYRC